MTTGALFPEITNATVAFDHNDNFYVASQENNFNDETGAVFLERYSFTGTSPSTDRLASGGASKMIYGPWNAITQTSPHAFGSVEPVARGRQRREQLHRPTNGSWSVKDSNTGSVYVALGTDSAGQRDDEQLQHSASLLECYLSGRHVQRSP